MAGRDHQDAEVRSVLLAAARTLLATDPNFSLKTLLITTSISRARFRRCFADKEQLLAALTGEEVKGLSEILEVAQPEVQSVRAAVGSDFAPAQAPAPGPMAAPQPSPGGDAWLERRLRVFERALAGLEKRQEKSEHVLTHQLALMGETITALARVQAAPQPAPQVQFTAPVVVEAPRLEPAKPAPVKAEPAKTEPVEPLLFDLGDLPAGDPDAPERPDTGTRDEADAVETAFAAEIAAVPAPVSDKEIADFMVHARKVAQNAALAEPVPPPRPWNMRWLAWSGAVLVTLLFCAGMLLASGAFGGPAGAHPVMTGEGVSHRHVAQTGIAHVIALADSGNATAQAMLAVDYLKGKDVAGDDQAARRWSLAAANQGQPVAQYLLGTLYLEANANDSEAVRWFRAAADQGNVKAMHNLAIAYAEGQGTEKNPAEAVKWFQRAAEAGYRDSEFDLGVLYERGLGVPQNARTALKWYLIAEADGDGPAAARADFLQQDMGAAETKAATAEAAAFTAQPAGTSANELPTL